MRSKWRHFVIVIAVVLIVRRNAGYLVHMLTDVFNHRLRLTDVKAGHFERKVKALEVERDAWEAKYEEMAEKHDSLRKQLEEFQVEMNSI